MLQTFIRSWLWYWLRALYELLFTLALPILLLRIYLKSQKIPAYRQNIQERLGFMPQSLANCVWFHSVSLGESVASASLITAFHQEYPEQALLLTSTTATGWLHLQKTFGGRAQKILICYFPYDTAWIWRNFFRRIQPQLLILLETELWPTLLLQCQQRHIEVLILNARLSARSQRHYGYLGAWRQFLFQGISAVGAQSALDQQYFRQLGIAPERVTITGNLKFDNSLPPDLSAQQQALQKLIGQRLVWIAASTHAGEEKIMLAAAAKLQLTFPELLLLLVPRHPERFDEVARLCGQAGLSCVRRSQGLACQADTAVFLGDSVGELLSFYSVSDIVFVGGSLVNIGGHNLLEPAVFARPLLSGPYLDNCLEIKNLLLAAGALTIVKDLPELISAITTVIQVPAKRHNLAAQAVVAANQGAIAKSLVLIRQLKQKTIAH